MFLKSKIILLLFFYFGFAALHLEALDWIEGASDDSAESTATFSSGDISGEDIAGELETSSTNYIDQEVEPDYELQEDPSLQHQSTQNSNPLEHADANYVDNNNGENGVEQVASSFQSEMDNANTSQQMVGAVGGSVGGLASLALGAAMIKQAFGGGSSKATESERSTSVDDTAKSNNPLTKKLNKKRKAR